MSNNTELMLMYSDGELNMEKSVLIENLILSNDDLKKEYVLNKQLDEFMRVQSMINHFENDPQYSEIDELTKKEISEYFEDKEQSNEGLIFFIKGALSQNEQLEKQIDQAEREMYSSRIENQALEWVKAWEENKEDLILHDQYTKDIVDYVKKGMNSEDEEVEVDFQIKKRKGLIYKISAVAAVLILAVGLWGIIGNSQDSAELFTQYYEPYSIIDGQTRSSEHQIKDIFKDGVKLYKNGNFSEAGLKFKELIELDNSQDKIILLYGITLIEENEYNNAILRFNQIINTNGEYSIEAKWYLSLCYLKTNKINEAKTLLRELSGTPGYYKNKAVDLLEKL